MTVLPVMVKVQSTSRVSLNDRFTGLMKSRVDDRYVNEHPRNEHPTHHQKQYQQKQQQYHQQQQQPPQGYHRPTAITDIPKHRRQRATERYDDHSPIQQRNRYNVHNRVGQKNFPGRVRKKYTSFWDTDRQGNSDYDYRPIAATSNYRNRSQYSRYRYGRSFQTPYQRTGFGHPLDRLQRYRVTERTQRNKNVAPDRRWGYGQHGYRNKVHGNRNVLDRDLDRYMRRSNRYNRTKLDDDMDSYMSHTKHHLDRSIDEYMSNGKKTRKIRVQTSKQNGN